MPRTLAGKGLIGGFTRAAVATAWLCALVLAAPAGATPVATSQEQYSSLGRVFPDPLANCTGTPCSPFAQGNVPATQFIGYQEFVSGMRLLNSKPEWRRYLEVWPLDGKMGEGSQSQPGDAMFPGNDLGRLEFKPRSDHQSAGLATSTQSRSKSDMYVVRVTDETVPDKGKKRYALSLSIHGIERAGAEGGIRAIEDLVTAQTLGRSGNAILPKEAGASPSFGETLRKTIFYFSLPNPDGWRRGSVSEGGVFFQRYNGNGMDVNRDWPDIGFSHRFYSANSEPETRALNRFFTGVESDHGQFTAGDDLHGQPFADALSYTMMPHGRHDWPKNARLTDAAKKINTATNAMVSWSPIVQPNSEPQGGEVGCAPDVLGTPCAKIYGQTWGTVYDTINYTTAGTLGDWFDSTAGLNADGIDNEMSFSHLDRNITFDPHTEQMHVDGNKALIWSHVTSMLNPPDEKFDAPGRKGYVPNTRLKREEKTAPKIPAGTVPQDDEGGVAPAGTYNFTVKGGKQPDGKDIYNGGMRIQATAANVQGIGPGVTTLTVECRGCDSHLEREEAAGDDWVTVAEDFNQAPTYAQAGVTVSVNQPQAFRKDGRPVEWRAVVSAEGGPAPRVDINFSSEPASDDGNTGGDPAPRIAAYDVANTDVFRELSGDMVAGESGFEAIDPKKVIAGTQSLSGLDSLVLADDGLPGYKRQDPNPGPRGTPPAPRDISSSPTVPGAHGFEGTDARAPGTFTRVDFDITDANPAGGVNIKIAWASPNNDFDMYLYRVAGGEEVLVGSSTGTQLTTNSEEIDLDDPLPSGSYRLYVDNFAAADPTWSGKMTFKQLVVTNEPSSYSEADKDKWFAAVRKWVEGGGNLVLTDGALSSLTDLVPASFTPAATRETTVYAGQITFAKSAGDSTVQDPLAQKPISIAQPGARFNSGNRRQTYEPTPLGFAIQQDVRGNDDTSFAEQWDVDRKAWELAGGRTAGTSVDSGARDAAPVHDRTALGELKVGKGQIRIAGGLLPQPSTEFNHPLGIEPYSLTYTGYILLRNLLEVPNILSGKTIGGRFLISGRAVKMKDNRAGVRVSCRKPFVCKGKLTLTTRIRQRVKGKIRKKTVNLGAVNFNIGNKSRNRVLQVPIRKKSRKYVLRTRRVNVLATAPISFTDGKRGTARNDFWFYRPTSRALRRGR
ncbi:MAG TPA: M14 family zinc carboxypeptidase [Thermoleophilaceae bacterium]